MVSASKFLAAMMFRVATGVVCVGVILEVLCVPLILFSVGVLCSFGGCTGGALCVPCVLVVYRGPASFGNLLSSVVEVLLVEMLSRLFFRLLLEWLRSCKGFGAGEHAGVLVDILLSFSSDNPVSIGGISAADTS